MQDKIKDKINEKSVTFNNGLFDTIGNNINFNYKPDVIASGEGLINQARSYAISNNWQLLTDLFFSDGILQRIVCTPVEDAFKKGIVIKSDMLGEDIKSLQNDCDTNILDVFKETAIWCRLYGGGGVVIETAGEPKLPLNIKKEIKKGELFALYSADLWELNMMNTNMYVEEKPYVASSNNPTPYAFYGQTLHKSRVVKMLGQLAPARKRPLLRGWGMSVLEKMVTPYTQYIKYRQVLLETLDETKVSTFYIPTEQLQSATTNSEALQGLLKAIQEISNLKNFKNAVVLPIEAKMEQTQLNFGWVDTVLGALQTDFASSCGFPKTKLFGDSATGFASGQDSLENYNMMVEGLRGSYIPHLKTLLELRCQYLFGFIPADLEIAFPPLETLNAEQEETIKDRQAERVLKLYDRGIITAQEVIGQLNANNILPSKVNNTPVEDFPTPPVNLLKANETY